MHDLTGFQRDLLTVIAGMDDPHGLAIKDELEEYYGKEIHAGRLYPNLDTLANKGLIEKGEKDQRTPTRSPDVAGGNLRTVGSGKTSTLTKPFRGKEVIQLTGPKELRSHRIKMEDVRTRLAAG